MVHRLARDQRGLVFPSPVVIISVVAVVMAGVAFLTTRGGEPTEREISTVSQSPTPSPSPTGTTEPSADPSGTPNPDDSGPEKPQVDRSKVYVVVFNNSNVTGLASRVAAKASSIGWQVVGTDNWFGTIPTTTVYYPPGLKPAAQLLALDLGIERVIPAVDPMRPDRVTVILTGPLDAVE